jgi:hypothetical protein
MSPSRNGLSGAAKAGAVVLLIVLVLGGAYFAPSLMRGGNATATSSGNGAACSGSDGGNQTVSLLALFACFSQMQLQVTSNTVALPDGSIQQQTIAYRVLGTASFNSTQHTKVEFSQVGGLSSDDVIAWFNSRGVIDRLDVLQGRQNYTGPGAPFFAAIYTSGFGTIPALTNNATLLSMLSKTSENTTSLGPTELDVATYHLAGPTSQFKSVTMQIATIPGTSVRFAVYIDQKATDGSETTIQVQSVTK